MTEGVCTPRESRRDKRAVECDDAAVVELRGPSMQRDLVRELSRRNAVLTAGWPIDVTAWFAVLIVFVLAEVFREGARLRREAELTI